MGFKFLLPYFTLDLCSCTPTCDKLSTNPDHARPTIFEASCLLQVGSSSTRVLQRHKNISLKDASQSEVPVIEPAYSEVTALANEGGFASESERPVTEPAHGEGTALAHEGSFASENAEAERAHGEDFALMQEGTYQPLASSLASEPGLASLASAVGLASLASGDTNYHHTNGHAAPHRHGHKDAEVGETHGDAAGEAHGDEAGEADGEGKDTGHKHGGEAHGHGHGNEAGETDREGKDTGHKHGGEAHGHGHGDEAGEVHGDGNDTGHEHAGEAAGHGHGHGHDAESDSISVAISATLTCAILFIMGYFYLFNHPRSQVRRYAYNTINATISIFSAILLFQGIDDVVAKYVGYHEMSLELQFAANLLHMMCWLALMQFTLALFAGILGPKIHKPFSFRNMTMNIKCWSVLLAHITGFASLNAWGTLSQAKFFTRNVGMEFLLVPVAVLYLFFLERITDNIREYVALRGDEEKDKYETAWDDETEEAENDVMAFTVSFLIVQAVRGLITGHLPSPSGQDVGPFSRLQVMQLFGVATLCILLITVVIHVKVKRGLEVGRFFEAMNMALCMGFAWSVFFASSWYLHQFPFLEQSLVLLAAVQAVSLSIVSFVAIFALDLLSQKVAIEEVDEDIEKVINGLGMLVGFSWEQCFHHATHSMSHSMHVSMIGKLLLSVLCLVIILPAWRLYLMPMVISEGWRFGFIPQEDTLKQAFAHLKEEQEKVQKPKRRIQTSRV